MSSNARQSVLRQGITLYFFYWWEHLAFAVARLYICWHQINSHYASRIFSAHWMTCGWKQIWRTPVFSEKFIRKTVLFPTESVGIQPLHLCPAHHQAASSLCSIAPFSSHCDAVQRDLWDQKWSEGKGAQFWGFLGQALIWEVERPLCWALLALRFNNFISHCQLGVILESVPVLHCRQHYYNSCILGVSLKKIKLCVLVDFT